MNIFDEIKEARLRRNPIVHEFNGREGGLYCRDGLASAKVYFGSRFCPKYSYKLDKETFLLVERGIKLEKAGSDSGLDKWFDKMQDYRIKYEKEHKQEIDSFREKYPGECAPLDRASLKERHEMNEQLKNDIEIAEENTFELGRLRISERMDLHYHAKDFSVIYSEGKRKLQMSSIESYCDDVDGDGGYHVVRKRQYPMNLETEKLVADIQDARNKKDKQQGLRNLYNHVYENLNKTREAQYGY